VSRPADGLPMGLADGLPMGLADGLPMGLALHEHRANRGPRHGSRSRRLGMVSWCPPTTLGEPSRTTSVRRAVRFQSQRLQCCECVTG